MVIFFVFYNKISFDYTASKAMIILVLAFVLIIPYAYYRPWWTYFGNGTPPLDPNYNMIINIGNLILFFGIISYFFYSKNKNSSKFRYILLLLMILFLKLITIFNFPVPQIDVWNTLSLGPTYFLHGIDPYGALYSNQGYGFIINYFPYPPGIMLLLLPIRFFNLDVRYIFLLCQLAGCLLIYYYSQKNERAELYSFLFLIAPSTYFFLHFAWTELCLFVFFAVLIFYGEKDLIINKTKKISAHYWRPLMIGFLATLKQTVWIFGPFYIVYILKKSGKKVHELVITLSVFFLITLPFFLWNPSAFFYDVWTLHASTISLETMTANSFLARNPIFGIHALSIYLFLIPYAFIIIIFYYWEKITHRPLDLLDVFKFGTISYFLFLLWGTVANMNHYFMIIYIVFFIYIKLMVPPSNSEAKNDSQIKHQENIYQNAHLE